jgi:hypothetical protein
MDPRGARGEDGVNVELLELGAATLGPLLGRDALVEEVRATSNDLRVYLAQEITRLRAIPRFDEWVAGALRPDAANQARIEAIVLPRLAEIVDPV